MIQNSKVIYIIDNKKKLYNSIELSPQYVDIRTVLPTQLKWDPFFQGRFEVNECHLMSAQINRYHIPKDTGQRRL